MTTITPQRLLDLWPALSPERRAELVETAERMAAPVADGMKPVEFTADELAAIEQGSEDFKHGRTLRLDEFRADMDAFFARLKAKHSEA